MKKLFKILAWIIFILVLFLIGIGWFFNRKYGQATQDLKAAKSELVDKVANFRQSEVNTNPEVELPLLPVPKSVVWKEGTFIWPKEWEIKGTASVLPQVKQWANRLLKNEPNATRATAQIRLIPKENLSQEGYELTILANAIEIHYQTSAGLYYGMVTLHQLQILFPNSINQIHIADEPDLAIRGVMLDISRDKVPKLSTLKEIVDKLSLLKYNHLQLYIEGFSFGYPSFKPLWEKTETPLLPAEIQELAAYCQTRFIDLAPNQNALGHMQTWLATDTYAHLAECPNGYGLLPMMKMKTTLDAENEESIQLIEAMTDDLLPNFSSSIFNVNLDEPFELGHCKNEALAADIGVGQIYLNYVLKVHKLAKDRAKEMWMWGDIINKHPELLDQLPKDITLLEWGYEAEHPFEEHTARIKAQGLPFLVCPGTSSWMSLTGRTDNMFGNIENAVLSGLKNGAKGMLLTDWGDLGHWQYLPISYAGFAYAGAISWNSSTTQSLPLQQYLNTFYFKDDRGEMANIVLEMGRYNQYEERQLPNMNLSFMAYQFGIRNAVLENTIFNKIEETIPELVGSDQFKLIQHRFDEQQPLQIAAMTQHLNHLEENLNKYQVETNLAAPNNIKDELRNGIQMVRLGTEIRHFGQTKAALSSEERINYLEKMQQRLTTIQEEHRRLWLQRNKSGGLERSSKPFDNLAQQISTMLTTERGSDFGKSVNALQEKVLTGGVNWYLN